MKIVLVNGGVISGVGKGKRTFLHGRFTRDVNGGELSWCYLNGST